MEFVSLETHGAVTLVRLDRPPVNALSEQVASELLEAFTGCQDPSIRAVVVTGQPHFAAGADIKGFKETLDSGRTERTANSLVDAIAALEALKKPTIAAVHGFALGGGCELTMVTDLVVCDTTARFGTPEAAVGLMPGLGVVRGRANTNLHWLKHMIFTGEQLGAEDARRAGLVTTVVPEGVHLDEALRQAALVASKPAVALQVAKRILNRGSAEGYDYSVEATALLHSTADQREGVTAFKERRTPRFEDR
jgi:enoyl-CoA hydratase/carnithine racemase